MNDQKTNHALTESRLNERLDIDRTGYCAYCKYKPGESGYCAYCKYNPGELMPIASQRRDSKCCGCWFSEEKPNWEQMPNVK